MGARHQCPFVNRPDGRCSERLNIDRLGHAFSFCFNAYEGCPVYLERLVERRVRQLRQGVMVHGTAVRDYGSTLVQIGTPPSARAASARPATVT